MHDIVLELTIAAAPAQVFQAVSSAEGLARWWTDDVRFEAPPSAPPGEGTLIEASLDEHSVAISLRVDTLDPPVLAHLTCIDGPEEWPGTQVAFRLEPTPDATGTVVRFWHGGWEYEDGVMPRVSFEWALRLEALRQVVEPARRAGPDPRPRLHRPDARPA